MSQDLSHILDLGVDIGHLLLRSGAETYRVEDTVYRVIAYYGGKEINVYAVPNCLIVSAEDDKERIYNRLKRVGRRSTDLGRVRSANELSRQITAGKLSMKEAYQRLDDITHAGSEYPSILHYLGAGMLCSMFTILNTNGGFANMIAGFLCGLAAFTTFNSLKRLTNIQFFSEMGCGFIAGWVAFFLVSISVGTNINAIILSSVMPMVPGRAITTGIRDLMANDYISGVSILADAMLTAAAIGVGVASVLAIL